jgi:hypothetical protein
MKNQNPTPPLACLSGLACVAGIACVAGCAQPLHLQYDFGRAYTDSLQIQANLARPSVANAAYAISGTEAILIRENVLKEDVETKSGKVESIKDQ